MQNFVDSIGSDLRAEHSVRVHRRAADVFDVLLFVLEHPDYELLAVAPDRELRFLVEEGRFRLQETYRLVPHGEGETQLSLAVEIEPRGSQRLATRAIRRLLLDEVADLESLKVLLDDYDEGPATPAKSGVRRETTGAPFELS